MQLQELGIGQKNSHAWEEQGWHIHLQRAGLQKDPEGLSMGHGRDFEKSGHILSPVVKDYWLNLCIPSEWSSHNYLLHKGTMYKALRRNRWYVQWLPPANLRTITEGEAERTGCWEGVLGSAVFWTWHGYYTHELTQQLWCYGSAYEIRTTWPVNIPADAPTGLRGLKTKAKGEIRNGKDAMLGAPERVGGYTWSRYTVHRYEADKE